MNSKITLNAYSKLNLFLGIEGTLPNGYHSIRSVMQQLSLADEVEIRVCDGDKITVICDNPDIPTDDGNIAYKAAALFAAEIGRNLDVEITISKKIPIQAGMGGSSADGAAVLLGLNQLLNYPMEATELLQLGASLGADVPFCMTGGTQLCTGTGTQLSPIKPLPECFFVIIKPDFSNNTKEAYRLYDSCKKDCSGDFDGFKSAYQSGSLERISEKLFNAFELLYENRRISEIKSELIRAGALGSCMTGSGSAVFGIFGDEITAKNAQIRLPFTMKFITKGLNGVEMSRN